MPKISCFSFLRKKKVPKPAVITISAVSDFTSPACWICKKKLDSALELLANKYPKHTFRVQWEPFPLVYYRMLAEDPERHRGNRKSAAISEWELQMDPAGAAAGAAAGTSYQGPTRERADTMVPGIGSTDFEKMTNLDTIRANEFGNRILAIGQSDNLRWDQRDTTLPIPDTIKAHALMYYTGDVLGDEKQNEMAELLFRTYFRDNSTLDDAALTDVARQVFGDKFDEGQVQELLSNAKNQWRKKVTEVLEMWLQQYYKLQPAIENPELTGIPFYHIHTHVDGMTRKGHMENLHIIRGILAGDLSDKIESWWK